MHQLPLPLPLGRHSGAWEAMMHSWRTEGPLGLFDKGKLTSQVTDPPSCATVLYIPSDLALASVLLNLVGDPPSL